MARRFFYHGEPEPKPVPIERKIHAQLMFFCTLGAVFALALWRTHI